MASSEVGVGYVRLVPSMRGFGPAAAKGMQGALPGPASAAGRHAGTGFVTGFGNSLQSGGRTIAAAGDQLTLGVTIPVLGLGAAGLQASRTFNAGMANIATLIPGNTQRVGELGDGIRALAIEGGKSTSDLTEGMYNVVSAFGDTSDSMSILEINSRAATAGLATTTDAINLTSAVTKGYGDTSAEAVQQASDLALLTVRMGQTTFPELASSMGSVIPIASNLGVSQEELFASMATLTGVTGSASEVSTQMRGAMQGLLAPTGAAAEAIEAAGFASGSAAVEELGLAGAVGLLTSAAEESGEPLQSYLSSIEGQTFALALAGSQSDKYESSLAEMADAAGTTDDAYAEMTTGVNEAGFEMDKARARAADMAIALGDGLGPALLASLEAAEPLIGTIADLSARFAEADPETQKMILAGAGLVAALGPVMSIAGRVTTAIGGTVRGIASFGRGVSTAASTSVRLGAAVGRGAMAFGRLALAAGRAGLAVARAGVQMAVSAARAAARVVASIATQIARWVVLGVQALLHAAKVALAWLISLGPIALVIAAVVALVALVIANWDKVSAFITAAASWIWQHVTAIFTSIRDWVGARITDIVSFFSALPGRVVGAVARVKDHVVENLTAAKNWVMARVTDMVRFLRSIPGRIVGAVNRVYVLYVRTMNRVKTWIRARINDIVGFFKRIPGRVSSAISRIVDTITSPFRRAFDSIKSLWNRTVGGFGFSVPDWIPGVGGKGFTIPKMHTGGIVPGTGDQLILARGGEGVFTPDQMAALGAARPAAGGAMVTVVIDGNDQDLKRALRRWVRVDGRGDVQVAFGGSRRGPR